jgi:hypothetical protein
MHYPPIPPRKSCNCEDPCISTDDVYYAGPNLPNSGVNTSDLLTVVIEKLDAVYAVPTLQRVTEMDNLTTLPIIADSFVKIGGDGTNLLLDDGTVLPISNLPVAVTKTSELINDGQDGINPFITALDIPAFVPSDYDLDEFTNNNVDPFAKISDIPTISATSPILYNGVTGVISHATTDGNLHVPATGTTNNDKVLTAGATAGSLSWKTPPISIVNTSSLFSRGLSAFAGLNSVATRSIFIGESTGLNATNASDSNFFGAGSGSNATNALYSNFIGQSAGRDATDANSSNFLGSNTGYQATNADSSNFLGSEAGYQATNARVSNFLSSKSGYAATNANQSNFLGYRSGYAATNASFSNFIGNSAGDGATDASYSNLFGHKAGSIFSGNNIGSNNIIIGTNISLPNATTNAINLGNVLFGIGTYSNTVGDPSIIPSSNGRIGIGVVTPSTRLHIYSEVADTSGLRLERLTSASPISTGQAIGVDANGNVVNVTSSALVFLNEGNGNGIVRADRDPTYFGNIGLDAFDISFSNTVGDYGATGEQSFAAGYENRASGYGTFVIGNECSANGIVSIVTGYYQSETGTCYANFLAGVGHSITGGAYATIVGQFANVVANNPNNVNDSNNTMFAVGNGTATTQGTLQGRSTAFQVYRNGRVIASSLTTALITADVTGKILTTKEFVESKRIQRLAQYTVATLPTGVQGDTAYVTDASVPTYLGTVVGGGSVVCKVFYNGTNWIT